MAETLDSLLRRVDEDRHWKRGEREGLVKEIFRHPDCTPHKLIEFVCDTELGDIDRDGWGSLAIIRKLLAEPKVDLATAVMAVVRYQACNRWDPSQVDSAWEARGPLCNRFVESTLMDQLQFLEWLIDYERSENWQILLFLELLNHGDRPDTKKLLASYTWLARDSDVGKEELHAFLHAIRLLINDEVPKDPSPTAEQPG